MRVYQRIKSLSKQANSLNLRMSRYWEPISHQNRGQRFFERVAATQIWGPHDNEKGSHLAFCSRKRGPPGACRHPSLLQRSRPNGSRSVLSPPDAELLPRFCCLSNVCRHPPPRSRLPVRVAHPEPRHVKAARGGREAWVGARSSWP